MSEKIKVQTGLRIPIGLYEELSDTAERQGISINALSLALIDIGMSVIRLGTEEVLRSLLHTPQDNL